MIASRVGLAILAVIALALGLLIALDAPPAIVDRALVPGFDPDRATELAWQRPGQPAIVLARDTSGWRWADPAGRADPRRVGDVLAALRGARWHRDADPAQAGDLAATLRITTATGAIALGIGRAVAGGEQAWLVVDGRARLVDGWVARALDAAPLALRDTAPFAEVGRATAIEVTAPSDSVTLAGQPRHLVQTRAAVRIELWPSPRLVQRLEDALAAVVVDALPVGASEGEPILTIALTFRDVRAAIAIRARCPGHAEELLIDAPSGRGCVSAAPWAAARDAIQALRGDPLVIADRRPLPIGPARLVLADGSALELAGRPHLVLGAATLDVDAAAASELLGALAAPAELVAPPPGKPAHSIVATDRELGVTLDLYPPDLVVRRGEPLALRVGEGVWQLVLRPGTAYRTRALWREEPTTVSAITIDGIAWQRGAVVGEWRRGDGPSVPAPIVEALVGQLAAPDALADAPHGFAARHHVSLAITAPGTPAVHALELGAALPSGCPVRTADREVLLPAAACALP